MSAVGSVASVSFSVDKKTPEVVLELAAVLALGGLPGPSVHTAVTTDVYMIYLHAAHLFIIVGNHAF